MTALLRVDDLHTFYGSNHILFGLKLEVKEGEVVVLLGRNGAGKTTSLKSIMGVVEPRSGTVEFRGGRIGGLSSDAICRAGIGYVPEDCRVFKGLSVRENLQVARRPARDREAWDEDKIFYLFPDLKELLGRRADALSGGQQRMLAIGRTLMGNPDLILLDEPSEGLAPLVVQEMLRQLKLLKASGLTVLLSEQNLRFSLELADRAYIIEKGEIRYEGTTHQLRQDSELSRRYLMV